MRARRRAIVVVASVAVVAVATDLVAAWLGMDPQPVLLAALAVAVLATLWGLGAMARSLALAVEWPPAHPAEPPPRLDWQVAALRTRVSFESSDHASDGRLHATLVALIDDRLSAAHGVDRRSDPQAAGAILGDELTRFVAGDRSGRARWRRGDLERIVAGIEGL